MTTYSWSAASALWQVKHGEQGTERTDSAADWLASELGEHEMVTCSDCGSEWCATSMREIENRIGGHSQDISYRPVCSHCWQRDGVTEF